MDVSGTLYLSSGLGVGAREEAFEAGRGTSVLLEIVRGGGLIRGEEEDEEEGGVFAHRPQGRISMRRGGWAK